MAKIDDILNLYYSRKDVQDYILQFSQNRETVARYMDAFGKRPDSLQYPSDIIQQAKNGATSFHCSQELWQDPLAISTSMSREDFNRIRKGWDLLIDIDSKYLDYSKVAAQVIIEALEFHGVKNYGIKFSGSKGFHIIVPWKAFPEEINGIKSSEMFPEWPRLITGYLTELIKQRLIERIPGEERSYVKDFDADKKVMPDIILVSPRHLFRCPYSLHEKTAMASIVITKEEIKDFQIKDADPLKVKIRNFYPQAKENEARELLIQALDWEKAKKPKPQVTEETAKKYRDVKVDKSSLVIPPSIARILEGIDDGKKRALFVLLNFFTSLDFTREEIESKIAEWNKKNKKQLKEEYIQSQLEWTFRQKKMLPPNYDKPYYKDIGIMPTEDELKYKNPVNYAKRKSKWLK